MVELQIYRLRIGVYNLTKKSIRLKKSIKISRQCNLNKETIWKHIGLFLLMVECMKIMLPLVLCKMECSVDILPSSVFYQENKCC